MESNLEKQLGIIIEKALKAAEQTGEFVIEQGTDLLQQFYAWHTATSIVGIVFGLFLVICFPITFRIIARKEKQYNDDARWFGKWLDGDLIPLAAISSTFSAIVGVVMFCISVYHLIKILVAPKLYLIEYFVETCH